ncbi:hypothetical protein F5887DRAFT_879841 [Amanita rubescens]|nr:hypothetical protein F5887DRAFT_879841 [Amanita rubescens]
MLDPQAFDITRRTNEDDDLGFRVAIRQYGGSGGGGSGGSSGGGGGASSGNSGSEISTSSEGGTGPAVISGTGGGTPVIIPNGDLFAGRTAGGGTRALIFGNSQYGSGYPNITSPGTAGRGFPFYFWPVVWAGNGTGYLYPTDVTIPLRRKNQVEGPLFTSIFSSNATNTTFRILSDNQTVIDLISTITSPCSSNLQTTNIAATAYSDSSTFPKPEQAIQYYRASSIVLTLDGYNNTADLTNATSNVPLPSNIDQTLLNCVNTTIGTTAPLVNAASGAGAVPATGLVGLAWIVWILLYLW